LKRPFAVLVVCLVALASAFWSTWAHAILLHASPAPNAAAAALS
jgi:hypothetical protein